MGLSARMALYGVACLALMVLDSRYDALSLFRSGSASLIQPVQNVLAHPFGVVGRAFDFFQVHADLLTEKRQLKLEHDRLAVQLQQFQRVYAENRDLRSLLNLTWSEPVVAVAAEITRVLPDPFSRRLLIDRGSAEGIEPGRPVVDADGLIGQITQVSAGSSVVTLLTAKAQAAPVQNRRNGLRLIVTGTGTDNLLEVRYLDMHADLKAGDILVTSGIDSVYPAGIPVARVLKVEQPRETPFALAHCQPLGAPDQNRHLLILMRRNTPS